ncbi:MAG: hypothetical protein ACRDCN_08245 [Tannerellaceae bacterium]
MKSFIVKSESFDAHQTIHSSFVSNRPMPIERFEVCMLFNQS